MNIAQTFSAVAGPQARIRRRRIALFLGAAALPLAMGSAAQAQAAGETIILQEGVTVDNVALGAGNDNLVVDISRVTPEDAIFHYEAYNGKPELVSGTVTNAGGNDKIWLRANSSQTVQIVRPRTAGNQPNPVHTADGQAVFTGGTVYEARGAGTVLTLQNIGTNGNPVAADLLSPLRVAGDGTVEVTFGLTSANQAGSDGQALYVEQNLDNDERTLNVVLKDLVVSGGNSSKAVVDVTNAKSLTLDGGVGGLIFRTGTSTGIEGGEADIVIERGVQMQAFGSNSTASMIRSSGTVTNKSASFRPQNGGVNQRAVGVELLGGTFKNVVVEHESGTYGFQAEVRASGSAVAMTRDNNVVENYGLLQSTYDAAISSYQGTAVTRNGIYKVSNGSTTYAGSIVGGTVNGEQLAYIGYNAIDFLVNSGTITGNIDLGNKDDMFLFTEASNGVTGEIEGGNGLDGYGKSFSASATHQLANNILGNGNSGFEFHGIEARGLDTTITVTSNETLDAGLMLVGDGTVINAANITQNDGYYGIWARRIANVASGMRVINRGQVLTTGRGFYGQAGLKSFVNEGLIRSSGSFGVIINIDELGGGTGTLNFNNSGTIETASNSASAVALQFDANASGPILDFVNSGTITHTGQRETVADYEIAAVDVGDVDSTGNGNNLFRLVNAGTIQAAGNLVYGLSIDGPQADILNSGTIKTAGKGAFAVWLGVGGGNGDSYSKLTNTGLIRASGDAWLEGGDIHASAAVLVVMGGDNVVADLNNDADGVIEATGSGSSAILVGGYDDGKTFNLTNKGTIRGAADTDISTYTSAASFGDVLAGAIHTANTIDVIRNEGLIQGNIDLGALGDEIRNSGRIEGDVRLGSGDDRYIIVSGGVLTGTADGGDGDDSLQVDFSVPGSLKINASQFANFETLSATDGALHNQAVSLFGAINTSSWQINNMIVRIDQGDTLSSASGSGGATLTGGAGQETVINNGTIAGGLDLGGGNDTLNNTGTIGGNVDMGAGDDVVTNSGTISGNLNLGDGNDRYEALGGLVSGSIDGGDGEDTFVFRLNGNDGSIPGGFTNFESFGAYGPGTLTLALTENYNTIELLEGANLTLQEGTGTVGLVKGDSSAQYVKIEDADFNGSVDLGAGNDTLEIELSGALTGQLDGGADTDTLILNLNANSSINDLYNFEIVNVKNAFDLTLTGTLGAGQQINFDENDNTFIVDTGAVFEGTANGGAGNDTIRINTGASNSRTIVAGQIVNFENLDADGEGTLELNGEAYAFDTVNIEGNLSIGDGASLASAGGVIFNGNGNHRLTLNGTGNVTSPVTGGTGIDTLEFALAAGQMRNISTLGTVTSFETLAASGAGTLNIDQNTTYDNVKLEGGHINVKSNVTLTAANGGITGDTGNDTLSIETGATIVGDIGLGGGNDVVTNAGTIGNLYLGAGDDRYIALAGSHADSIDGGVGGNDTFVFRLENGEGVIPNSVTNFESFGAFGPGTLTVNLDAGQDYTNLELYDSANLIIRGSNGSVTNVIGDGSAQTVTIDGNLTGGVDLGGGDDTLNMSLGGILSGALNGGAGRDTLNLKLTAASTINGMSGFEIANIDGEYSFTLAGDLAAGQEVNFVGDHDNELIIAAGVKFEGKVNGGEGDDLLRVQSGSNDDRTVVASQIVSFEKLISEGAGTLALTEGTYTFDSVAVNGGNFELGANTTLNSAAGVVFDGTDNRFTLGSGATVTGGVNGGDGFDILALVQGAGTVRSLKAVGQTGFEALETSGAGELRIDENTTFTGGVFVNGGTTTIATGATLTASVYGEDGNDIVAVLGSLNGDINLRDGDDTLIVSGLGNITGEISGGEGGNDRIVFNTAGTYEAPTVLDAAGLAAYDDFESLGVSGGVVSLAGETEWTNVGITGGRLIGQAGSVITSETAIEVAHGATFGSAGIVNGNINVAGTLSPGASPGTMTVNGDVNFLAGSNLLLELTPEVSDLLNISGKMTIANGAAVDITGILEGTPGNTLDLVVAAGGIEGRFTTINKSATVFGFVVQNGNRLQIQSEFLADGDYPSNVQAAVDYSNQVLRSGYGIQAYTAALPVLVDAQGNIDERAFAQLTPEAYGSAMQIGVETSLQVVDSSRTLLATTPARTGLYGFAQAVMAGGEIKGQADTGASKADGKAQGFFGGIGYGLNEATQVGAFIGKIDNDQALRQLGAATDTDGFVAGVYADAAIAGVGVHGVVAYSGTEAETTRSIAAATSPATAKYDLNSWVADLSVDYQLAMGSWTVTPKVGVTYVNTKRDGVVEDGAGVFGLTVAEDSKDSWFADAGVALSGTFEVDGMGVTPYFDLGVRQMLNDGGVAVTGGFTGAGSTLIVNGVERDKTVARFGLGFGLDLTRNVRFHAGYTGEFSDTNRDTFTGGVAIRF